MGAAAYAYKPQLGSVIDPRETDSRRKRRRRTRIAGSARRLVLCVVPLVLVLLYVGLMAGLTAQTYRLAADQRDHTNLIERNNALRSQVAQLESVDRLEAVARQLHMSEPNNVAFITTVPPRPAPARTGALFAHIVAVTRLFGVR
ncbi:MAG: septum formation initiator family protein [Candidatus Eremiobacteraeota bacterium]|nr:septum formation initiator family protein [Candidatus Eremiobacteraeota bacterium]